MATPSPACSGSSPPDRHPQLVPAPCHPRCVCTPPRCAAWSPADSTAPPTAPAPSTLPCTEPWDPHLSPPPRGTLLQCHVHLPKQPLQMRILNFRQGCRRTLGRHRRGPSRGRTMREKPGGLRELPLSCTPQRPRQDLHVQLASPGLTRDPADSGGRGGRNSGYPCPLTAG